MTKVAEKKTQIKEFEEIKNEIKKYVRTKRFFTIFKGDEKYSCHFESSDEKTFVVKMSTLLAKTVFVEDQKYKMTGGKNGIFISFEAKCIEVSPYSFRFDNPREIEIVQKRMHPRIHTLDMLFPFVVVDIDGEFYTFKMFDLSQGGLAFLIPKDIKGLFMEGQHLFFKKIGRQDFAPNLEARITHISDYPFEGKAFYKLGVQFIRVPDQITAKA